MKPIIKWAGGKRQLLPVLRIPEYHGTYYEPFVGGGAVLFEYAPKNAIINDINPHLCNMYKEIRDHVTQVLGVLRELEQPVTESMYQDNRNFFNRCSSECGFVIAAHFIWLNHHCFNGVYRENSKGEFNVPWNKDPRTLEIDRENILAVSEYLKSVHIYCGDYQEIFEDVSPDDFVFLDPPYDKITNGSFTRYNKSDFGEQDQRNVANLCKRIDLSGARFITTNHDTSLIRELYSAYHIEQVNVRRSVSRSDNRTGTEVIIRNYEGAVT